MQAILQFVLEGVIPPAPKTVRGNPASLDAAEGRLAYFNGNVIVLLPTDATKTTLLTIHHSSEVVALRFSPDGKLLASIDDKGTLMIHEVHEQKILLGKTMQGFYVGARCIDWTSDSRRICVVGNSKRVYGRVVSVDTGTNIGQISAVSAQLNSCSFRPDRPYKLALGGDQHMLKFYQGPPYNFVHSKQTHKGYIYQIKYSPKGSHFVTVGADRKIIMYDGLTGEPKGERVDAHCGGVYGIDWIDEDTFVTCSADKTLKVWDISMQERQVLRAQAEEKLSNIKLISKQQLAVRCLQKNIYSISLDGTILTFAENSVISQRIGLRTKPLKIIKISEEHFILLDTGGKILAYDLHGQLQADIIVPDMDWKGIADGYYSVLEGKLFVLYLQGSVAIISGAKASWKPKHILQKIDARFIADSFSSCIICLNNDKLFLYNLTQQAVIKSTKMTSDPSCLTSSAQLVVVGTVKGKVLLYNSKDLSLLQQFQSNCSKVSSLCLTGIPASQQSLLLMGDSQGKVGIYRVFSGKECKIDSEPLGGHNAMITSICSDDEHVYTFSLDNKFNVWQRNSWKRVYQEHDVAKCGILHAEVFQGVCVVAGGDLLLRFLRKK